MSTTMAEFFRPRSSSRASPPSTYHYPTAGSTAAESVHGEAGSDRDDGSDGVRIRRMSTSTARPSKRRPLQRAEGPSKENLKRSSHSSTASTHHLPAEMVWENGATPEEAAMLKRRKKGEEKERETKAEKEERREKRRKAKEERAKMREAERNARDQYDSQAETAATMSQDDTLQGVSILEAEPDLEDIEVLEKATKSEPEELEDATPVVKQLEFEKRPKMKSPEAKPAKKVEIIDPNPIVTAALALLPLSGPALAKKESTPTAATTVQIAATTPALASVQANPEPTPPPTPERVVPVKSHRHNISVDSTGSVDSLATLRGEPPADVHVSNSEREHHESSTNDSSNSSPPSPPVNATAVAASSFSSQPVWYSDAIAAVPDPKPRSYARPRTRRPHSFSARQGTYVGYGDRPVTEPLEDDQVSSREKHHHHRRASTSNPYPQFYSTGYEYPQEIYNGYQSAYSYDPSYYPVSAPLEPRPDPFQYMDTISSSVGEPARKHRKELKPKAIEAPPTPGSTSTAITIVRKKAAESSLDKVHGSDHPSSSEEVSSSRTNYHSPRHHHKHSRSHSVSTTRSSVIQEESETDCDAEVAKLSIDLAMQNLPSLPKSSLHPEMLLPTPDTLPIEMDWPSPPSFFITKETKHLHQKELEPKILPPSPPPSVHTSFASLPPLPSSPTDIDYDSNSKFSPAPSPSPAPPSTTTTIPLPLQNLTETRFLRRFDSLNLRNLLELQSQLTDLESQLSEADLDPLTLEARKFELLATIAWKLELYNKALVAYQGTLELPKPENEHEGDYVSLLPQAAQNSTPAPPKKTLENSIRSPPTPHPEPKLSSPSSMVVPAAPSPTSSASTPITLLLHVLTILSILFAPLIHEYIISVILPSTSPHAHAQGTVWDWIVLAVKLVVVMVGISGVAGGVLMLAGLVPIRKKGEEEKWRFKVGVGMAVVGGVIGACGGVLMVN